MLFFLTLTQNCNLRCTYCGSDENYDDLEDISVEQYELDTHPKEINYDLKLIERLKLVKDDLAICFYGGEPLLKTRIIYKVMDMIPNAKFIFQTNATLLHTVKPEYLLKVDTILCSIDGTEETTDKCRGKGTHKKIMNNVKLIRERGYKGDVVARMTVSVEQDTCIYDEVMFLINAGFDHVHWQLDCNWDTPDSVRICGWKEWRDNKYNPGITKLVKEFIENIRKGRVLPIAPFTGCLWTMLRGEKVTGVRCASGISSFNITTGGHVSTCPIAAEVDCVSKLTPNFDPEKLRNIELIGEPCLSCDIFGDCGGRCLYANETKWWGEEGFEEVCVTVKHLIKELRAIMPEIQELIEKGVVSLEDFHYPTYNNSIEIIP